MAESMKDYEKELEESMKTIEEGDILTGTVISVDEKEVILDLKYYAEGVIPAENYSREPGFSLKDEVHEGDEVSATVVRKDDGQGNILLSRVEAVDVLAWDKLKELKESGEVLDVVVKGITNAGVIAYVEGVRGFIPASKLALNYVEDTEEYLNKPIQVQVLDVDKESKKLILSAKESALLLLFMKHPQQVFTKDMIYEHVWGNTVAIDDNAIMVYINRLRGKIEDNKQSPQHIITIRGLGYRFIP